MLMNLFQGCDVSLLVDSTPGNQAEKEARSNEIVRGFDFIDEMKKALETICTNIVSCVDIIALDTRDVVVVVITFSPIVESC
jgi:peroxidase